MKICQEGCEEILDRPNGVVERFARVIILLSAFLLIAYVVWTLNRGFEITDEAYYLLLAMHADSVKFYISAQQWITSGIWQVTGSLVMFRAAGMIVLLTSSALLALGVLSAGQRLGLVVDRLESRAVMFAGTAIGALLYASTINLSPSYNLLASAGAYAAAGMVLLALNSSNNVGKFALFALAGAAVGVEFLCKASAGIATLALLACWVVFFECSRSGKIFGPVALTLGAGVSAGIVLRVNTTIGDAAQIFEQSMQLFRMVQVEPIGARLVRYASEFHAYSWLTLRAFAMPVVAMLIYVATRRAIFAQFSLTVLVIILMFGGLDAGGPVFSLQNAISGSYLFGGFGRYGIQIVAIVAMLIMALSVSASVWKRNKSTLGLLAGLILLPYTVVIGTGNMLFTQIIDSLAPWGALIALLVIARVPTDRNRVFISLIGVCFMATVSLQIVTSAMRPYNLSSPLTKQDQAITVGDLGRVKVDAETHQFLTDMQAAVERCHIAPGAPYLGLYNIPGVALTLQATPVATPWLNNRVQAEFVIERARPEELHQAIVALQMGENEAFPALPRQLEGFPSGYQYCGRAIYPYMHQHIQIWQSQT